MNKFLLSMYPLVLMFGYIVVPNEVVPMKVSKKKSVVVFKDIDPFPNKGIVKNFGILSMKVM